MSTITNKSPYSLRSTVEFINNNFALIVMMGIFFMAGFFGGSLWTENQIVKAGGNKAVAGAPTANDGLAAAPEVTGNLADMPKITKEDHVRGNANAKVMLVEYSDYECPFCGRFHPTTTQVLEEMGDKVGLVYRHYPLSFHPNAQKSAEGAECVAKLGGNDAFWKYTDALFEVNNKDGKLSPEAITQAAATAGVNATSFKTCLDSGEMAQKVSDQMSGGSAAGVTGTPGTLIVVDGEAKELIPGALPFAQVKTSIEKYL